MWNAFEVFSDFFVTPRKGNVRNRLIVMDINNMIVTLDD